MKRVPRWKEKRLIAEHVARHGVTKIPEAPREQKPLAQRPNNPSWRNPYRSKRGNVY